MGLINIPVLLNEISGGGRYEDRLERYRLLDLQEILTDARENLEANGYDIEEIRPLLSKLFYFFVSEL